MEKNSFYPGYDVLKEKEHWDSHTKGIVLRRLDLSIKYAFFKKDEVSLIKLLAKHLVYENRDEILDYIVYHLDEKLKIEAGEGQRKVNMPPQDKLIRDGLKKINLFSNKNYGVDFYKLDESKQCDILTQLQQGSLDDWEKEIQKEFFKKLLVLTVESYYSHPSVWSEIGYGGPAYPRGYVRVELGLVDPWEAKQK